MEEYILIVLSQFWSQCVLLLIISNSFLALTITYITKNLFVSNIFKHEKHRFLLTWIKNGILTWFLLKFYWGEQWLKTQAILFHLWAAYNYSSSLSTLLTKTFAGMSVLFLKTGRYPEGGLGDASLLPIFWDSAPLHYLLHEIATFIM